MKSAFSNPNRPVCVAVAFDEHAPSLIKSAESFAARFDSPLLLVHVTEPWVGAAGMGILPVPEISDRIQQEMINKARNQLEELAGKVRDVQTIVDVRLGVVADEVIASALHHKAKIIFTGHVSREPSFLPMGFSSALGVMGNAPIPVMVISESNPADFNKGKLHLMIADDLSDAGKLVLAGGFEFAASLNASIDHVHANGVSKDSLESALSLATAAGKGTPEGAITGEEYLAALHQAIETRMDKRAHEATEGLGAGVKVAVTKRVVDGHPDDAIAELVDKIRPEVLAFGRHHTFHRKPFLIGRVPFKAMLKMSSPGLLIIPPEFDA